MHRRATLADDDVDPARRLGLPLEPNGERTAFRLPCPRFDGRCTVYEQRPGVCRTYQCRVTKRVLRGELEPEPALKLIHDVKQRLATVRELLGQDTNGVGLWGQVDSLASKQGLPRDAMDLGAEHSELVLALVVLGRLLDLEFRPPDENES